jgi:hypothetical protein
VSSADGDVFGRALRAELRDIEAGEDLAASVIARYRTSRRRRLSVAGSAAAVFLAGLAALLTLVVLPGQPGTAELRLSSYRLTLPDRYRVTTPSSAIPAGSQQKVMAAVGSDGRCVAMSLTAPFRPGPDGDPNIPRDASPVSVGSYRAWLTGQGCGAHGPQYGLVFEMAAAGGRIQDLTIESSGLSRAAFISLVAANLSSSS